MVDHPEKMWRRAGEIWENLVSQSLAGLLVIGGHLTYGALASLLNFRNLMDVDSDQDNKSGKYFATKIINGPLWTE